MSVENSKPVGLQRMTNAALKKAATETLDGWIDGMTNGDPAGARTSFLAGVLAAQVREVLDRFAKTGPEPGSAAARRGGAGNSGTFGHPKREAAITRRGGHGAKKTKRRRAKR